jgi:hypothetical protein
MNGCSNCRQPCHEYPIVYTKSDESSRLCCRTWGWPIPYPLDLFLWMSPLCVTIHSDNVDRRPTKTALRARDCQSRTPDVREHFAHNLYMFPDKPSNPRAYLFIAESILSSADAEVIKKNPHGFRNVSPQDLKHDALEYCDRIGPTYRQPRGAQ